MAQDRNKLRRELYALLRQPLENPETGKVEPLLSAAEARAFRSYRAPVIEALMAPDKWGQSLRQGLFDRVPGARWVERFVEAIAKSREGQKKLDGTPVKQPQKGKLLAGLIENMTASDKTDVKEFEASIELLEPESGNGE